jgi:hypothetical protein
MSIIANIYRLHKYLISNIEWNMEICKKLLERIRCSTILNFGLSVPFNVLLDFAFKLLLNKRVANELFCGGKMGQVQ